MEVDIQINDDDVELIIKNLKNTKIHCKKIKEDSSLLIRFGILFLIFHMFSSAYFTLLIEGFYSLDTFFRV